MLSARVAALAAVLLLTLMLPLASVHALGVGTPRVSSGLNQPLQARVPLLDSGALSADQVQVSLADERLWRALGLSRSAATDTLRLDVQGTPGALYLRVRGTRPLDDAMLETLMTLRWPQGAITPRITLLPSIGTGRSADDAPPGPPADSLAALANPRNARQPPPPREITSSGGGDTAAGGNASQTEAGSIDNAELAALRSRLEALEERLQAQEMAQTSLTSSLSAGGSTVELIDTLDERQQQLAARLDRLSEQRLASLAEAPSAAGDTAAAAPEPVASEPVDSPSATTAAPQQASSSAGEPSASAPSGTTASTASGSFPWLWLAGGLALFVVLLLALRQWRERGYRPVSADEMGAGETAGMSDDGDSRASSQAEEGGADNRAVEGGEAAAEATGIDETQAVAIRDEAAIFEQYGRLDQARELLEAGLESYPQSEALSTALAALIRKQQDTRARHDEGAAVTPTAASPHAQPLADEERGGDAGRESDEGRDDGEQADGHSSGQPPGAGAPSSPGGFSLLAPQELELQESERERRPEQRRGADIDTSGLQLSGFDVHDEPGQDDDTRASKVALSHDDADNERPASVRGEQRRKR